MAGKRETFHLVLMVAALLASLPLHFMTLLFQSSSSARYGLWVGTDDGGRFVWLGQLGSQGAPLVVMAAILLLVAQACLLKALTLQLARRGGQAEEPGRRWTTLSMVPLFMLPVGVEIGGAAFRDVRGEGDTYMGATIYPAFWMLSMAAVVLIALTARRQATPPPSATPSQRFRTKAAFIGAALGSAVMLVAMFLPWRARVRGIGAIEQGRLGPIGYWEDGFHTYLSGAVGAGEATLMVIASALGFAAAALAGIFAWALWRRLHDDKFLLSAGWWGLMAGGVAAISGVLLEIGTFEVGGSLFGRSGNFRLLPGYNLGMLSRVLLVWAVLASPDKQRGEMKVEERFMPALPDVSQ